jgi:hypothetical protein
MAKSLAALEVVLKIEEYVRWDLASYAKEFENK